MVLQKAAIATKKPQTHNKGPPLQSRDYISADKMDRGVEERSKARPHEHSQGTQQFSGKARNRILIYKTTVTN